MSGSGASNLGYGNLNPYSTSPYVNGTSSTYSGSFSSNEIPGLPGLAGSKSNIDAAAGIVPGICLFKGGAKKLKRKIKNITRQYKKMKAGSKKMRGIQQRLRSRMASRSLARSFSGGKKSRRGQRKRGSRRSRSKKQRGGYPQYQNNLPMTQTYQVAGINLPASELALANPPPVTVLPNCTNCVDNYSRFTNTGFPSKGH
jgi:hypothetical protein